LIFRKVNVRLMCARKTNLQYAFRLYLNADGQRVLGKGGAQILEAVEEYGSIAAAAKELEMSYKFAWDYLVRMRRRLHQPVIVTHRGGTRDGKKKGGGGTMLTPVARALLKEFRETERLMRNILTKRERATVRSVSSL
jgi:molybdate transport system regulatory protein